MSYTSYRDMETKIANNEPFEGNSVIATLDLRGAYRIYSYSTLIYDSNGYFNTKKYSSTTSRLQNMIKRIRGL